MRLSALVAVKRPSIGAQLSISESMRPPKTEKDIQSKDIYVLARRRTHYAERSEREEVVQMHMTPDEWYGRIAGHALHVARRLLVRRGHRLHPTRRSAGVSDSWILRALTCFAATAPAPLAGCARTRLHTSSAPPPRRAPSPQR